MKLRRFLFLIGFLLALPVLALIVVNVFLNTWLPVLINRYPERFHIDYRMAWMVVPGEVHVKDLELRGQGPGQQWLLHIDRVDALLDLEALQERKLDASQVRGMGTVFRYRLREEPSAVEAPPPGVVEALTTPPIPGLENPPDPIPEDIYPPPKQKWRIKLTDVSLDGLREVWLQDYRYAGDGRLKGDFNFTPGALVQLDDGLVELTDGALYLGETAMVKELNGDVTLAISPMDPGANAGIAAFRYMTAQVALLGEVEDLGFVDFYLSKADWLHFSGGKGELRVDVSMDRGKFLEGSSVSADARGIVATWFDYAVTGDGRLDFAVLTGKEAPESTIRVAFTDYVILRDGDVTPHVEGKGLIVSAVSPDIALDKPFSTVALVLDLPDAVVRDFRVYNIYLPTDVGLALGSGSGHVRAHLELPEIDGQAFGDVWFEGKKVRAKLDDITLTGDVSLHGNLKNGDIGKGTYDVSGSSLSLKNVNVVEEVSVAAEVADRQEDAKDTRADKKDEKAAEKDRKADAKDAEDDASDATADATAKESEAVAEKARDAGIRRTREERAEARKEKNEATDRKEDAEDREDEAAWRKEDAEDRKEDADDRKKAAVARKEGGGGRKETDRKKEEASEKAVALRKSTGWWAEITVPSGKIAVGAPVFLDASVIVKMRDTAPFITMFAAQRELAPWVQGILQVTGVKGSARFLLGDKGLTIPNFAVKAGDMEVLLRLRKEAAIYHGVLLAMRGKLSMGMKLDGEEYAIQAFNAPQWYAAQPAP